MDVERAIEKRRSTREFTERRLTKGEISEILRAGTLAPSACNMQSWYFYVIADAGEREKLRGICADWISRAPVVIVVCTDDAGIVSRFGERARKFPMQDTSLAMENMLLRATEMGLGGCVVGAYKQGELVRTFNIPAGRTPVALLPIGEPLNEVPATERKPLEAVSEYVGEVPEEGGAAEKPFELMHAGLPNAVFDDLNLSDAKFNNINLSNAEFGDTNLSGAKFGCCEICEKEKKFCVEMKNSAFSRVDMSGADFKDTDLSEAVFGNPDFDPAEDEKIGDAEGAVNLSGASFCGVNMTSAAFDGALMTRAQMNNCDLVYSVLTDIKMAGAKLYDVDLDESNLSGVNMVGAEIRCTNLYGSKLSNCCLSDAALENCDIGGMTIDGISVEEAIRAYKEAKGI